MRKHTIFIKLITFWVVLLPFAINAQNSHSSSLPSLNELQNKNIQELLEIAGAYADSDSVSTFSCYQLALNKAQNVQDKFLVCRSIGYFYEDNNNIRTALNYYEQAAEKESLLNPTEKANIFIDMAIANRKLGNYQKARDYYAKTLEVASASNDVEMVEYSYDGIGNIYYLVGDYNKAIEYTLKSLHSAEQRQFTDGILQTLKNLSQIYLIAKHSDLALQNIQKAYQIALPLKNNEELIAISVIHGNILSEIQQYPQAILKIEEALNLALNEKINTTILNAYLSGGDIYIKQQQYEKAKQYFDIALKHKQQLSPLNLTKLYYELGKINSSYQNYALADVFFKKSLAIAEEYKFVIYLQKNSTALSNVNKALKKHDLAFLYLEKANIYNDSIFSQEKVAKTAELLFKYNLEKSEKDVAELKLRESKFMLISGGSLFVLMLLFLLYLNWIKSKNNQSLRLKNKEIKQQNKKLAESNEILRQFAFAAAHDLKEPLRNIGSFASLIQRRFTADLPEDMKRYLGFMSSGVNRMYSLLEDLLAFSTLITSDETIETITELNSIETAVKNVVTQISATIEDSKAQISCAENLPLVPMSELHLKQILQNLITNSIKFVENDVIPIITINAQETNEMLQITIKDNGIGIDKQYSDKIFLLFQRLHKEENRYGGTGVGLTICKNIVDKYNGKIWFDSEPNEGTTFHLTIPRVFNV